VRFEAHLLDDAGAMNKDGHTIDTQDRSNLHFEREAREAFKFLEDLSFILVEALATLVRYRKDGVEVDVYHGRQSYEIGAGVTAFGTRYSMGEILDATDPEAGKTYRVFATTSSDEVVMGLKALSELMKQYGTAALQGAPQFFMVLAKQREQWSQDYARDTLARQLRPQAYEAFRQRDYSTAAELYNRIRDRLSSVETKKLALAEKRRSRGGPGKGSASSSI
jgi:hypothetical protein